MPDTVLICSYCSNEGTSTDGSFDMSSNGKGMWCDCCDMFTYLNPNQEKHSFICIAEDKSTIQDKVDPTRKFMKQLSPFRYPGGKSKFIDYLYTQLRPGHTKRLYSPFTGGGSFELAMLEAGVVEELHLNDLDYGVFSLYYTILNDPLSLIHKIESITPTHDLYFHAQSVASEGYIGILSDEAAWLALVLNRLAFSGIPKANPLGGRTGTEESLLSRWNTTTLIKRIQWIHSQRDKIQVSCLPASLFIENAYWDEQATLFIDPPYIEKGKALYTCYFTQQDHYELATQLDLLHLGMPGADILLTYDAHELLYRMYEAPDFKLIGRQYSI